MSRLRPSPEMQRRKSSTLHYQTFSTAPPKSRGRPPQSPTSSTGRDGSTTMTNNAEGGHDQQNSPLPLKQLAILAVIALSEQTALNSISPYLPQMTADFPGVEPSRVGLYVGSIASSFALAQFATNFFWGWLSDQVGRKPVVMLGTILTAACFFAFGFCRALWQAILVQSLMGLVNGNQGVISTCLGEITDRSNQSKAFVYLPVIYGIGGITGPALGGLFVRPDSSYPYLLPNLFSAGVLIFDFVLTGIFLEESLEEARDLPPLKHRIGNLFSWLWQFSGGSHRPTYLRQSHSRPSRYHSDGVADDTTDSGSDEVSETQSLMSLPSDIFPRTSSKLTSKEILNRDTILLLSTYLVFQLSNISFNSLFPIFVSSQAPTGRDLKPEAIGLLLAFAGAVTIVFQVGIFGRLKEKMGNKATYRAGLLLFFFSMMIMPWVGYSDSPPPFGVGNGKIWLWFEVGMVLLVKTVAAVGGLTSALLLITNSAPNHSVLGTLNGLAQTLSAAGRAAGPFFSGALFTLGTRFHNKGELLPWGVFGGIAFGGWIASWGIRSDKLESADWDVEHGSEDDHDDEDEVDETAEHGHRARHNEHGAVHR